MNKITLIVIGTHHPIYLPTPEGEPVAAPWWPMGPVTACIDNANDDPDVIGWIEGFDKADTSNTFDAGELESVLRQWFAQFGSDQWVFETYVPGQRETVRIDHTPFLPKAKKKGKSRR